MALGAVVVEWRPASGARGQTLRFVLLALLAVPAILIFVPMLYIIFLGLTLRMASFVAILAALLVGLLLPQCRYIAAVNRWALPLAFTVISLGLFIAAR